MKQKIVYLLCFKGFVVPSWVIYNDKHLYFNSGYWDAAFRALPGTVVSEAERHQGTWTALLLPDNKYGLPSAPVGSLFEIQDLETVEQILKKFERQP